MRRGYKTLKIRRRAQRGRPPVGQPPPEATEVDAAGVGNEEYQDLLDGRGSYAGQKGMLHEMKEIFDEVGVEGCWQQDGARAHTIAESTERGQQTRALIASVFPRFIDGWPANSPDLSPIENVWRLVERNLWTEQEWSDLEGFKAALRRAWSEVTGNKSLLKRLVGSFENRRQSCIARNGAAVDY